MLIMTRIVAVPKRNLITACLQIALKSIDDFRNRIYDFCIIYLIFSEIPKNKITIYF